MAKKLMHFLSFDRSIHLLIEYICTRSNLPPTAQTMNGTSRVAKDFALMYMGKVV